MAEFQTAMSTAAEIMVENAGDIATVLQALQGRIHFVVKKLKPSHVPGDTTSTKCTLMIPVRFVEEHSDKFQRVVTLRSRLCREPFQVRLNVCKKLRRAPEIKLGKGWKDFATRNELMVGDSLIFELKGVSEFEVYVFRGATLTASSSHAPAEKNCGANNSPAGGSSHQHNLASEGTSVDGISGPVSGWIAKKRKDGGEFGKQEVSVQASSEARERHDSENSHEVPPVDQKKLKMPCAAQDTGSAKKVKMEEEFQQAKISLPSFMQRLVVCNVQDAAGNTCGACLEIPFSFVKTRQSTELGLEHVKLQGIREESPVRTVTCTYKITQEDMEERAKRTFSLSLGWGDFVRENGLRAGQVLVFTLAAESFFVVREVSEIDI